MDEQLREKINEFIDEKLTPEQQTDLESFFSKALSANLGTTEEDTVCPECGGAKVKKVVSAFSFGPAGGGFSVPSMPTGGG